MNVYTAPNGQVVIEEATVKELQSLYSTMVKISGAPIKTKNILPRPVIRDGNGKLTKLYSTRDWFMKLQEEISEAMEKMMLYRYGDYQVSANIEREDIAEEIADIITVCISYLNALGYDEEKRSEIFRKVNEKNEKRGYFKEAD